MTLEQMLNIYPCVKQEINRLEVELLKALNRVNEYYDVQTSKITGMPRGTEVSDIVYKSVEKIIDLHYRDIERLTEEITELKKAEEYIKNRLTSLNEKEYKFFELACKYGLHDKAMRQIRNNLHVGKSTYYRLRESFIEKMGLNGTVWD